MPYQRTDQTSLLNLRTGSPKCPCWQKRFLWPTDLNLSVSIYIRKPIHKSDFYFKNWLSAPKGFDFRVFTRENRPKMSLIVINAIFISFSWSRCLIHLFGGKLVPKSVLHFWIRASGVPLNSFEICRSTVLFYISSVDPPNVAVDSLWPPNFLPDPLGPPRRPH